MGFFKKSVLVVSNSDFSNEARADIAKRLKIGVIGIPRDINPYVIEI